MSSEEIEGGAKQAKGMIGTVQQTGEQAYTKAKEVGHQVTGMAKTTMNEVSRSGFVERAANTGGKVIGYGLGKVAKVIAGFTTGFETGMKAGQQPKQQAQQQTQGAPQTIMNEEEKIEKKEMKATD